MGERRRGTMPVRRASTVLMMLIQGVLVVLFMVGYTARYVHPQHGWWMQFVALVLPYLAFAVVGLGVALVLAGRWGNAGLYLPLFLLVALRFFPDIEREASPGEDPGLVLRVMTYNAKSGTISGAGGAFDALVTREGPDVLALQEVLIRYTDTPGVVIVPSGLGRVLAGATYSSQQLEGYRLGRPASKPIFVRSGLSIVSHDELALGPSTTPHKEQSLVRAEIEWAGQRIAVYNLHLLSFSDDRPWRSAERMRPRTWLNAFRAYRGDFLARAAEAERIANVLASESLPFIVCGDFNSTRHQWSYWRIASGLRDVLTATAQRSRGTFPARHPIIGIDHVLASDAWTPARSWVPRVVLSDHLPVVAELRLRGSTP